MSEIKEVIIPFGNIDIRYTPETTVVYLYDNNPEMNHVQRKTETSAPSGGHDMPVFDEPDLLVLFSGFKVPHAGLHRQDPDELAKMLYEDCGWNATIVQMTDAPDDIKERYEAYMQAKQTRINVVASSMITTSLDTFPRRWVDDARSRSLGLEPTDFELSEEHEEMFEAALQRFIGNGATAKAVESPQLMQQEQVRLETEHKEAQTMQDIFGSQFPRRN